MRLSILLLLCVFVAVPGGARAAELIMFNSPVCEWCEVWEEEIGVFYDKTADARVAPVRRIDIDAERTGALKDIRPIIYTPTFVVIDGGAEIGRITGYPGEDFFWWMLGGLTAELKAVRDACGGGEAIAGTSANIGASC